MSQPKKNMDRTASSLMIIMCMIWAIQQSVIKMIALDMAPTLQIGLRSIIGVICIAWVMKRRNISFALHKGPWKAGLIVGAMFALEFLFIGESLARTSASHLVIFLYTAPIFTALGLHWKLPLERLSSRQWSGILLSFVGIFIAFLGGFLTPDLDWRTILGDIYALLAGLVWGLTTVVLRCSDLNRIHPTQTTQYQLIMAFIILCLAAIVTGQTDVNWTPLVISAVIGQGILISFVSLLIWFWLLTVYNVSQLAAFSFLTPIFGVAFGVILLDEPLSLNFILGAMLVILGVAIVNHPSSASRPSKHLKQGS
ncbi:DMT family transporter [Orrella sp. 11846]|uniref:DMT family transporter n=1 Tax=Orrella sp. 11846 TaxID=3409913 RepID=UPI003B5C69DE